jgi:lipopolysaccharide export system permease protein
LGIPYYTTKDVNGKAVRVKQTPVKTTKKINVDSVFNAPNSSMARTYLNQALSKAKRQEMEFEFKSALLTDQQKSMRRHDIEMERKFTLSLACLIFFFIGAPLGAIIKKGGLGTPLVISVILFVIYYIFDNIGYKMAKDGKTEVWFGIWLSSMVLLPMGVFFTYKAIGESSVFDFDTYRRFLRRVFHIAEKRRIAFKEVVMDVPDNSELNEKLCVFNSKMEARIERRKKMAFFRRPFINVSNAQLREEFDALVVAMSYSRDQHVINLLNEYPVNITSRNASSIVATGKAISKLLVPESEVIDKNEEQSNEQPEAVDDENTATIEDTTDSDYGTEN